MEVIKMNRTINILIISLICALLIISCSNNTVKKESETIIIKEIPKTTLTQKSKLGEIPIDKPIIKKDYKLVNETNDILYINYALTNCGCTIGEFETEDGKKTDKFSKKPGMRSDLEIQPGKYAIVHLTIDTTGEEIGENLKLLKIFNDYNEIMIEIEISYMLIN